MQQQQHQHTAAPASDLPPASSKSSKYPKYFLPQPHYGGFASAVCTPDGGGFAFVSMSRTSVGYVPPKGSDKNKPAVQSQSFERIKAIDCDPDWRNPRRRYIFVMDGHDVVMRCNLATDFIIDRSCRAHNPQFKRGSKYPTGHKRVQPLRPPHGTMCVLLSDYCRVVSNVGATFVLWTLSTNTYRKFSLGGGRFEAREGGAGADADDGAHIVLMRGSPYDVAQVAVGTARGRIAVIDVRQQCVLLEMKGGYGAAITSLDWMAVMRSPEVDEAAAEAVTVEGPSNRAIYLASCGGSDAEPHTIRIWNTTQPRETAAKAVLEMTAGRDADLPPSIAGIRSHACWTDERTLMVNGSHGNLEILSIEWLAEGDGGGCKVLQRVPLSYRLPVTGVYTRRDREAVSSSPTGTAFPGSFWATTLGTAVVSFSTTSTEPRFLQKCHTTTMMQLLIALIGFDKDGALRRHSNLLADNIRLTKHAMRLQATIRCVAWQSKIENRLAFGTDDGRVVIVSDMHDPKQLQPLCVVRMFAASVAIEHLVWVCCRISNSSSSSGGKSDGDDDGACGGGDDGVERWVLFVSTGSGELRYIVPSDTVVGTVLPRIDARSLATNGRLLVIGATDGQLFVYERPHLRGSHLTGRRTSQTVLSVRSVSVDVCALSPVRPERLAVVNKCTRTAIFTIHVLEFCDVTNSDGDGGGALRPIAQLSGHGIDAVTMVVWSRRDADCLMSCGRDGTVRLWNVAGGDARCTHLMRFERCGMDGAMFEALDDRFEECSVFCLARTGMTIQMNLREHEAKPEEADKRKVVMRVFESQFARLHLIAKAEQPLTTNKLPPIAAGPKSAIEISSSCSTGTDEGHGHVEEITAAAIADGNSTGTDEGQQEEVAANLEDGNKSWAKAAEEQEAESTNGAGEL